LRDGSIRKRAMRAIIDDASQRALRFARLAQVLPLRDKRLPRMTLISGRDPSTRAKNALARDDTLWGSNARPVRLAQMNALARDDWPHNRLTGIVRRD
jgi:hypothetical protein